jgi:hypothetical protein
MGKERARAGLGHGALLVGFHPVIFQWRQQDVVYLDGVVAAALPDSDSPHCPVAKPQQESCCHQPEQRVCKVLFEVAQD